MTESAAHGRYRVELRKGRGSASFDYSRYPGFRYVRTGCRSRTYHWEAVVGHAGVRVGLK